jgi:hypothetical protein
MQRTAFTADVTLRLDWVKPSTRYAKILFNEYQPASSAVSGGRTAFGLYVCLMS